MHTTQHEHLGLQHGSKALLFSLVSFITFRFVHLIQLLYLIMVKHFPFLIHNYMTKFQIYIHCFVLPPLMERKVKCIVFLVLLLFLFFLLVFISSLFLAAISNTLISIQNQTYFLANKDQRTENLKQPV